MHLAKLNLAPRGYFCLLYRQGAKMSISTLKGDFDMRVLIAERLRALMREENLTQVELAKRIGVKQNTISAWLLQKKEPCITSLWLLADYFETDIDYLVGRKDTP